MFKKSSLFVILILTLFSISAVVAQNENKSELSLQGIWKFKMDPQDKGINENWFNQSFSETIQLPASMTERGLGDLIHEWPNTVSPVT